MPPEQCPECGRFLSNDFVDGLAADPAACPGCDVRLTAATFDRDVSVRPPDLAPEELDVTSRDVLAGWDVGADAAEIAGWREDRPPFPLDAVLVLSSGAAGSLLGASLRPGRRVSGAALGAVLGMASAAVSRRVWRLEP